MDLNYGQKIYLGQVDVPILYQVDKIPTELGWPYNKVHEIRLNQQLWVVQPFQSAKIAGVRMTNIVYVFYGKNSLPDSNPRVENFRKN